jgi:DNA-binding response OmpR family regulator
MVKIMVVDDEPDLRNMIDLMMQQEGYETEVAENGSEFLDKIDAFQPDIVTLDIMMPGLTTKDILNKLLEKKSKTRIILLTVVRFSDEEKESLRKLGNVVDYITKPFEMDHLLAAVKNHLNGL